MKSIAKLLFFTSILLVTGFSYTYADTMQQNNSTHNKIMMGKNMSYGSMIDNHMSNDSIMMHDKTDSSMMKQNMMMNTPVYQIKHGISVHNVKCATGFSLIFKSSDDSPACVKPSSVSILVVRGWVQDDTIGMMDKSMTGTRFYEFT